MIKALVSISLIISLFGLKATLHVSKPVTNHKSATAPTIGPSVKALTQNIEFGFCKANIGNDVDERLNELAAYLTDHKAALALRGHADSIGTYVGNWKMSDLRANAVKTYLVKKGVPADKIVTTPFGSTIPVASNKTAEGRHRNRRVEIVIGALEN